MKQICSRSHQQLSPQFHELISKRQLSVKPPHRLSYRPLISSLLPAAARSMLHPASTLELSSPQAAQCCTDLHALPLFLHIVSSDVIVIHIPVTHWITLFPLRWYEASITSTISEYFCDNDATKYVCAQPGASPVTKQILQNFSRHDVLKRNKTAVFLILLCWFFFFFLTLP